MGTFHNLNPPTRMIIWNNIFGTVLMRENHLHNILYKFVSVFVQKCSCDFLKIQKPLFVKESVFLCPLETYVPDRFPKWHPVIAAERNIIRMPSHLQIYFVFAHPWVIVGCTDNIRRISNMFRVPNWKGHQSLFLRIEEPDNYRWPHHFLLHIVVLPAWYYVLYHRIFWNTSIFCYLRGIEIEN